MARRDVIAIGASLGGVNAIRVLCESLPADLAATVCIVLHIGARGNDLLAPILDNSADLPVSTATDGEDLRQGQIYVAPADHHMIVLDGSIRLGRGPRENLSRPALDPLLRSIGISYGSRAIGVVLTGLLNDGASGLADLKRCGGTTVVQNPRDAEALDMPLGALRASDVDYRVPLQDLASLLTTLITEEAGPSPPVPDDVCLEVEIALGRSASGTEIAKFADPLPLSCPACGGVLSQWRHSSVLRFRCQVGHAYTADTLMTQKESSVDEAMRVALRIIEERRVLLAKMADDARQRGLSHMADDLREREHECREHADVLRRGVLLFGR